MKYKILLGLFAISLVFSILLAFTPIETLCGTETASSCSVVQNSDYKETLGINNSILGIVAFTILLLITLSHIINPKRGKKIFLNISILISAIAAIHFIYLQIFVLEALCFYCMVVDISTISALIILTTKRKSQKQKQ